MWELIKFTVRFQFVDSSKVVHVVADEGITRDWADNEWSAEYSQTVSGLERVRDWSFGGDLLDDEDIFISADVGARQWKVWCQG